MSRGISSIGRALALQARGQGFESLILHAGGAVKEETQAPPRFFDMLEGDTRKEKSQIKLEEIFHTSIE